MQNHIGAPTAALGCHKDTGKKIRESLGRVTVHAQVGTWVRWGEAFPGDLLGRFLKTFSNPWPCQLSFRTLGWPTNLHPCVVSSPSLYKLKPQARAVGQANTHKCLPSLLPLSALLNARARHGALERKVRTIWCPLTLASERVSLAVQPSKNSWCSQSGLALHHVRE